VGSLRRGRRKRGRAPGAGLPSACGVSVFQVICRNVHCEMMSSMAPIALSHGDGAPVQVRRTESPTYADFGGLNSGTTPVVVQLDVVSFPPYSSASTVAGCRLGGYPVGRDLWGGKRDAGRMSEDNERCLSTLVLGAFLTGVFQHHCITPH
jgi:hypothetical protein